MTVDTRAKSMRIRNFNTISTRHRDTTLTEHFNEAYDEDTFTDKAALPDGFISELNRLYEFRDDRAVDYLEKHPSLFNLLKEAHERIREYFSSDIHVVLDLVRGFEADDDERLFVFIQTEVSSDEALDRLEGLYEEWWLEALLAVRPKFSIDVEYV